MVGVARIERATLTSEASMIPFQHAPTNLVPTVGFEPTLTCF